jgi:hypothetical protein
MIANKKFQMGSGRRPMCQNKKEEKEGNPLLVYVVRD